MNTKLNFSVDYDCEETLSRAEENSKSSMSILQKQGGLKVSLISLHGLIRGHDLELGRDADTGGQVKYVLELARELAAHANVREVELLTRQIRDDKVGPDYAQVEERIAENAKIVRIPFGPKRYVCPAMHR